MKDLTAKQKAFVREYLLCRSGVEAMKKAGYKSKNPDVDASQLLKNPKIKVLVDAAEKEAQEKFSVSQEQIVKELAVVAFSNLPKVVNADGSIDDPDAAGFISSISKSESSSSSSEGSTDSSSFNYSTHNKVKALELLGKHIGMWRPKDDGSGNKPGAREDARRASISRLSEILRKPRK